MIYFKNTISGKLEEFKPIHDKEVGMYNCGPTVYGKSHIGNLRAYVFADLIKNVLEYNQFSVKQIINITDVGHLVSDNDEGADKVEEQAKKEKLEAKEITQKYTEYFMNSLTKLNLNISTTEFPKASENIEEQKQLITELSEKGFTYTTLDGIYFNTAKFPEYGKLGNINIEGLKEGARVESNSEKKNVTDFALWKFSKEKRLQEWDSPLGLEQKGFPGWHIECSAMASKYLGDTFDIHTGGIDHIPTHHNNEIAQSVCAHNKPLANYWLHVNHITIDGKKISKSLGNTIFLEDLEEKNISPIAYKYWLYTSHYSTLSNFTFDSVTAAEVALHKIILFIEKTETGSVDIEYKNKFQTIITNDLDTAKSIALVFELLKDSKVIDEDKKATILDFDLVFKLGLSSIKTKKTIVSKEIEELVQRRLEARDNRDFAKADALREEIEKQGYIIKDTDTEVGYTIEKK